MLYAVQVTTGKENEVETFIQKILPEDSYEQCFHPSRIRIKKFRGEWKHVRERLLPGYIFIATEDAAWLFQELKHIPRLTKLLGKDGDGIQALSQKDIRWLEALTQGKMEVTVSKVSIKEGKKVRVISGPLKEMEGMIRKIDLHRRVAEVEIDFMHRRTKIYLGIEILERV